MCIKESLCGSGNLSVEASEDVLQQSVKRIKIRLNELLHNTSRHVLRFFF